MVPTVTKDLVSLYADSDAMRLAELVRAKEVTPAELVETAISIIEEIDPKLNAVVIRSFEIGREAAASDLSGPFAGVPFLLKNIGSQWKGTRVDGGMEYLKDYVCSYDSTLSARIKAAGFALLGRTNSPEGGWCITTEPRFYGNTVNPWNPERTAGGSSGGAAAAVASGMVPLAEASDGGGSIRIPASYCGLFGIKPTFGRVPHAPHAGPFSTLVCSGPIARRVADAAAMLDELARPDARDWYALPYDGDSFGRDLDKGVKGLRIAVSLNFGEAKVDPEVAALISNAAKQFEALGAKVEQVGAVVPALRPTFEKYWLAGFGYILAQIPADKHALLDPHFLPLAQQGLSITKEEYFAGHMARVELGTRLERFFTDWDLLLMPTMPVPPPLASTAYHVQGNDRWEHATPFTVPFNYTGQPAASIPCGISKAGLPVGLQIVGPRFSERLILQASAAYEAANPMKWPQPIVDGSLGP
jgi:Asp-tRNA(Asn)/Glu-tRNA(Gln) amidotransferase A subunit family amidase